MTTAARARRCQPSRRAHAARRRCGVALCFAMSGFATAITAQPAARASPQPVGVIAPAGSRLASELRHELGEANLASVAMVAGDRDWPAEMTDLISLPYLQGVVVGSNDGRMLVFSRAATTGHVEVRFELRFDPTDRPARRRACLAVVESLRVLSEANPADADATAPLGDADADVDGAVKVERETNPRARTSGAVARRGWLAAATPVPAVVTASTTSSSAAAASAAASAASLAAAWGTTGAREPWVMGVATTLDVDRALAAPMGHLKFMWLIPVANRLAFRVQAMWPLMGTQLRASDTDVRVWTFGAALGLQYSFAAERARVRPFAGLAVGSQILLTDTSASAADKPRSLFVPSTNLRAHAGVRYAIASRVQLLAELEATRDWLIQPARQRDYGDSVANAISFHASLGVLFEY